MYMVKIQGENEWWTAPTMADIQNLSAKISIDTGKLVLYDEIEEHGHPELDAGVQTMSNVTVYHLKYDEPEDEPNANTSYQRTFRKKMDNEGKRLLRVYVPIEYYDECYKFCKEMSDD